MCLAKPSPSCAMQLLKFLCSATVSAHTYAGLECLSANALGCTVG
jgi:hypothetical protein